MPNNKPEISRRLVWCGPCSWGNFRKNWVENRWSLITTLRSLPCLFGFSAGTDLAISGTGQTRK